MLFIFAWGQDREYTLVFLSDITLVKNNVLYGFSNFTDCDLDSNISKLLIDNTLKKL